MDRLYRLYTRWDRPKGRIGDIVVVAFLIVQGLDGAFTYLGLRMWGPGIVGFDRVGHRQPACDRIEACYRHEQRGQDDLEVLHN